MSDYSGRIAAQLNLPLSGVTRVVELLDAENTIPFLARYRKEATGGLDEEQLRSIQELLERTRTLEQRRESIVKTIDEQGKLTAELHQLLLAAGSLTALEDLYLPYKPKRRTRASVAREQGLQPLADMILRQSLDVDDVDSTAAPYLNDQILTAEQAWSGAQDIAAEVISEHPEIRRGLREKALQWGILRVEKIETALDEREVYSVYYEFEQRVDRIRPHQVLAINRGETDKVLRVQIIIAERDWRAAIQMVFRPDPRSILADTLLAVVLDAANRLLLPAIERDVRRTLTELAENQAIRVFAANLRALLSQPPLKNQVVLGIDPGFRTGSKIAVVDATGKLLETATIYPHEPQKRWMEAIAAVAQLAARHRVNLITIGNGTASRETEQMVVESLRKINSDRSPQSEMPECRYLIVNEAGASVYSASPLAKQELPDLDVSLRGAVSIARRVQDPLAELVKIEPKAIGVGMYQHDVDQKKLADALDSVVESVVNLVGVDVNTASPALLTYVAGVGPKLAEKLVLHRNQNGPFPNRSALLKVSGFGPRAFEQAAGFLRVPGGEEPLDASAIHPESYPAARSLLRLAGLTAAGSLSDRKAALDELLAAYPIEELASLSGAGVPTVKDILEQLLRPGRDPRLDSPAPILRSDVLKMEDLAVGMRLKGTVRNVVDFGAFVDIGVKQDGLLHRSRIPTGTLLRVGDILEIEVAVIDLERGRIGLSWVTPAN